MAMLTVTDAVYLGGYVILCTFSTGEKRKVDLAFMLEYPAFSELKDLSKFEQFGVDSTIFWSNGADLAPEFLFEHRQAS